MKKISGSQLFIWGGIVILLLLVLFVLTISITTIEGLTEQKKTFTVVQFQQGPLDGPVNANSGSVQSNTNFVTAATNAKGDCFITNSC